MQSAIKAFNYTFIYHKTCYSKVYYFTQEGDSRYKMRGWRSIAISELPRTCGMLILRDGLPTSAELRLYSEMACDARSAFIDVDILSLSRPHPLSPSLVPRFCPLRMYMKFCMNGSL